MNGSLMDPTLQKAAPESERSMELGRGNTQWVPRPQDGLPVGRYDSRAVSSPLRLPRALSRKCRSTRRSSSESRSPKGPAPANAFRPFTGAPLATRGSCISAREQRERAVNHPEDQDIEQHADADDEHHTGGGRHHADPEKTPDERVAGANQHPVQWRPVGE